MKKHILHKLWDIFSYILLVIVILGGTIFAYYYAIGYRFNPINGQVKQTGVLSVQSKPTKAEIFLNSEDIGKSPKVTSVDQGTAKVKITKDGYVSWEKEVPIVAEKSTSLFPTLFLENPQPEGIYSIEGKIISQMLSPDRSSILALIQTEKEYRILKYELNKQFWSISDNPQIPFITSNQDIKSISMIVSQDGKWALVTKISNQKEKIFNLVKLTIPFQTIVETGLEDFASDYQISWSNDSSFLTLESKNDIFSYKVNDGTKYLLIKKAKTNKYIWNSDSDGYFYFTLLEKSGSLNKVSLIQTTLQGNNRKTILKDIFFQVKSQEVANLKSASLSFESLQNTKEEQKFSGDIQSFTVLPKSLGVFISTTEATYWYTTSDNSYILIHPTSTKYISTSPDQNKLIFFDPQDKSYYSFVFKIIPEDPTLKIGTNKILQGDNISMLHWSNDSQDAIYSNNGTVETVEYDGTNLYNKVKHTGAFGFSNDLEYLYMFSNQKDPNTLEVIRYKMY